MEFVSVLVSAFMVESRHGFRHKFYMNYILGWTNNCPRPAHGHAWHTWMSYIWWEGVRFPRDFLRESRRDGIAGWRPAPLGEGGQAVGLPFHSSNFPQEIPWKAHTFLTLVNKNIILCCRPAIPALRFSLRKTHGKPTPSWHWLIRISFYVWLEWQIVWIFSVIFSVVRMIFSVARINFSVVRIIFSGVKNDF